MSQADYRKEMYSYNPVNDSHSLSLCGKYYELFIKKDSSEGEKWNMGYFYNISLMYFQRRKFNAKLKFFNIYVAKLIVTIMCVYSQRLSLQSNEHCDPT